MLTQLHKKYRITSRSRLVSLSRNFRAEDHQILSSIRNNEGEKLRLLEAQLADERRQWGELNARLEKEAMVMMEWDGMGWKGKVEFFRTWGVVWLVLMKWFEV